MGIIINPYIVSGVSSLLTNLVAWWSLDEASGQRNDSHSNNLHLTDVNTVGQGTGKVGNCADFVSANSEELTRASESLLQPGDTDFSFSVWVKADSLSGNQGIFGKWHPSTAPQNEYTLAESGSDWLFAVRGATTQTNVSAGITVVTGTWYHAVCYHDSTANETGIILDDATPVTAAHTEGLNQASQPFRIGNYHSGGAFHDGLIDEVGYWSRLLTAAEITELYNSGSGIGYPG